MSTKPTLAYALELLKRLNNSFDAHGNRLSALVAVYGFEPWWFIQEQLFWRMFVPYAQHHTLFQRLVQGVDIDVSNVPSDVRTVCELVGDIFGQAICREDAESRRRVSFVARSLIRQAGLLGLALVSLIGLLLFRLTQRDTLVYTIDRVSPRLNHDFRITDVYRELRQREYRFAEYIHMSSLQGAWRNLWRRRRPVVFFEVLSSMGTGLLSRWLSKSRPVGHIEFEPTDPDADFLTAVARWALRRSEASAGEVRILGFLLRLHGARRAIVLDDSRHAHELIAACKSVGIPTLGYMHGLFNRYHPGLMAYGFDGARSHTFDLYGVWSKYFLRRLLTGDLYGEADTFISGPLRMPSAGELRDALDHRRRTAPPIRVLFISESRAPQEEVYRYLIQLLSDNRFRVVLKLRDGEQVPKMIRDGSALSNLHAIIRGGSVYKAFAHAEVVVGTYSTALYEAILALRPSLVLNTSFKYGHEIVDDGLAELAKSPEVVSDAILRAAALPEPELKRRRVIVWGEQISDGASTLFDVAEKKLWRAPNV